MRTSITNRLQIKLFFRLLGIFVSINILIIAITVITLTFYCENKIVNAANILIETQAPTDVEWMEFSGTNVRILSEISFEGGVALPFMRHLPYGVEYTVRGIRNAFDGLYNVTYIVGIVFAESVIEVEIHIGVFLSYFFNAFIALMVIEFLILLSQTVRDRKVIRKTMDPISDFARSAQNISDVNKKLNHEKMMALAGRLDGIDAGHLDARIQVDDMHSELKNVAEAINGMLDRINESYAAQARFVSDASHELRTPIAVIQGYANLLDRWGKEDEKALAESISAIKDEAESMKELVEQLLFLARGDSNRISLFEERVVMGEIVNEVVGEMRMLGTMQNITVSGDRAVVLADRALIKQALRILVDNATKYTDAEGQITISAALDGCFAKLSVEDNGIGISPDILPNVFDRFVRADQSRARATGGAGLGLSIAQWIAARHKGYMEVLSREGFGTKISFVIPALIDAAVFEENDEVVYSNAGEKTDEGFGFSSENIVYAPPPDTNNDIFPN